MSDQIPPNVFHKSRNVVARVILFMFSFLMEKDANGRLVLSGSRVTVIWMTGMVSYAIYVLPEAILSWPTAWMVAVIVFALRVHIDMEGMRPGKALELMGKLFQRAGRGTGVSRGGGQQAYDWDTEPEEYAPFDTTERYGERAEGPMPPVIATGEPIPRPKEPLPDAPATVNDAAAGDPPPSLAKGSEMRKLDEMLRANGIVHFSAMELAKPGRRHTSGVINVAPPPELYRNIIPTARVLEWFRRQTGRQVRVTSGFRSPNYNRAVGSGSKSMHPKFNATDIQVEGMTPKQVYDKLLEHPDAARFGLGLYRSFVHIDTRGVIGLPAPARW